MKRMEAQYQSCEVGGAKVVTCIFRNNLLNIKATTSGADKSAGPLNYGTRKQLT